MKTPNRTTTARRARTIGDSSMRIQSDVSTERAGFKISGLSG
jgi:hypothetical protein